MADSRVRVVLTATKEALTGVLRSAKDEMHTWSKGVTKIAAGIGLAGTFKKIGKEIKESIQEAAAAYPELAAKFDGVTKGFAEFRIQAGAAVLEVLTPLAPALKSAFDWAIKLAQQLPDAFDGVKIVLAGITGWFKKLPAEAKLAFGEIAQAGAEFALKAGAALPMLGLNTTGVSANLLAWSNEVIANAKRTIQAVEAETDRVIAKYGGTHDFGARSTVSAGAAAGVDRGRKAAEDALIRRMGKAAPRLATDHSIGVRDATSDALTNQEAGLRGTRSLADAYEEALEPLLAFNAALRDQGSIFADVLGPTMGGTADAIAGITQSLAESLPAHSAVAKAAVFAQKAIAKVEGTLAIFQGGKKIAEGLFPPNPAMIASGAGMVAQGVKMLSFAGGGGGAAGGVGYAGGHGGTLTPGGIERGRVQAERGKLIVRVDGASRYERSPEYRDQIVAILREAGALREVEFSYT